MTCARRSFAFANGCTAFRLFVAESAPWISTLILEVPMNWVRTSAIDDVIVPWAAGYSGWLGVVISDRQPGSSTVAGLPSSKPGVGPKPSPEACTDDGSIAVVGRQNRKWYLAFMTAI